MSVTLIIPVFNMEKHLAESIQSVLDGTLQPDEIVVVDDGSQDDTADVLKRFKRFLVPELNSGQLLLLLRGMFLIDAKGLNKVQGRPFLVSEIEEAVDKMLT